MTSECVSIHNKNEFRILIKVDQILKYPFLIIIRDGSSLRNVFEYPVMIQVHALLRV